MKKLLTLGALGLLASFGAQAQIVTDGQLTPLEIGTGQGKYQALGMFTRDTATAASFGSWGLKAAYMATDPNFMYIFVHGTVEGNGNAFQVFFNIAGRAGKPSCTPLPPAASATGDPTSFVQFAGSMDMETDAAVAYSVRSGQPQIELADYTLATPASQVIAQPDALGTPATLTVNGTPVGQAAYRDSPNGMIYTNTNEGLELKIALAAYGITQGADVQVFVLQNSGDGGYTSADFIPSAPVPTSAAGFPNNLGPAPDFCGAVAGTQFVTYRVGTGVVSGLKKIDAAALNFSVAPNPVAGQNADVSFSLDRAQTGSIVVTDLLGRQVAVLANGALTAGEQHFSLKAANLPSGQYLVKLQLGDQVATRKVAVL